MKNASASRILSFLLPTTTECWIVSGAGWCWIGARKKLVLDRCRIGVRWEKVQDVSVSGEREREWRTRARVENASRILIFCSPPPLSAKRLNEFISVK